jgi:tRNA(fMet)-specific endonuclease VapC
VSYLIDSDWLITFLNGRPDAISLLTALADQGIAVSIITCGEVLEGLRGASTPGRRAGLFEAFTGTFDVVAPDLETARQYGTVRSELRARGRLIPDNDLWLAATALAGGHTLVSRDRHFARVPGLRLYQP